MSKLLAGLILPDIDSNQIRKLIKVKSGNGVLIYIIALAVMRKLKDKLIKIDDIMFINTIKVLVDIEEEVILDILYYCSEIKLLEINDKNYISRPPAPNQEFLKERAKKASLTRWSKRVIKKNVKIKKEIKTLKIEENWVKSFEILGMINSETSYAYKISDVLSYLIKNPTTKNTLSIIHLLTKEKIISKLQEIYSDPNNFLKYTKLAVISKDIAESFINRLKNG